MNLTKFLKMVDEMTEGYTKQQLCDFVHEIARCTPEQNRDEFCRKLQKLSEDVRIQAVKDKSYLNDQYESIKNALALIESGDIYLEEIYNEDYDDWYNRDEDEYYYTDADKISNKIEEACDFVHKCLDEENYSKGFEIGRKLFAIKVKVTGDYSDDSEFRIDEMLYHQLINIDLAKVVYDVLYCGYMSMGDKENRIADMYAVICDSHIQDITVEGLIQHGDSQLPDLDGFLNKWTDFLGGQRGKIAEKLFYESVRLMNDSCKACVIANQYVNNHPGLYLQILDHPNTLTSAECIQVGLDAMGKIPVEYVVRSKTALKTAEYILKEKSYDSQMLEDCYLAAYESNTTPTNYLKAVLNGFERSEKRVRLDQITYKMGEEKVESFPFDDYYRLNIYGELCENKPGKYTLVMLEFLAGSFEHVLQYHMNVKEALGWSYTFMKQGIAIFLLYLHKGEWNTSGIKVMTRIVRDAMVFSSRIYNEGFVHNDQDDDILFQSVFNKWKAVTPMDETFEHVVLNKLEELIEKRTDGIMIANKRKYYGECAAYIAALGEVMESCGHKNAKQMVMTKYKEKYSRRSAFRSELKACGWHE